MGESARSATFDLRGFQLLPSGRCAILCDADPQAYYVLYRSPSVTGSGSPEAATLGSALEGSSPGPGPAAVFFRVRRIALTEPLDLDGDGIHDVYELRHRVALDPLDAHDASKDFDGDGQSNLQEFRDGTDPLGGLGASTVYVVDDPTVGSTNQFRTLVEAVAWLNASLLPDDPGHIVLSTERPQAVETLELAGHIEIEVGTNFAGRVTLTGPDVVPIVIRAPGGVGFAGIQVQNVAGLEVHAGQRVALRANRLPATTIRVGGGRELAAIPRRLPSPQGGAEASVLVANSVFSGPLRLEWFEGLSTDARLGITDNSAPAIEASVAGTFGGHAEIRGNLTQNLALVFDALAAARIEIGSMANLERLAFTGTSSARSTLQVSEIIAGNLALEIGGTGSLFATLAGVSTRSFTLDAGAASTEIEADRVAAEEIVMNLASATGVPARLRVQQRSVTAKGGIRFNAWNAEQGELDLRLALVNAGELEISSRASTSLELTEGVTLTGQLKASVTGSDFRFNAVGARVDAGLEIHAAGVGAGLQGFWQGGTLRGDSRFECAHGVTVGLVIDGTIFDPGGLLAIRSEAEPSGASPSRRRSADFGPLRQDHACRATIPLRAPSSLGRMRPEGRAPLGPSLAADKSEMRPEPSEFDRATGRLPRRARPLAGTEGAIILRNLTAGPGAVEVLALDSAVTLERCAFSSSGSLPAVMLEDLHGAVRIEDCQISGQSLAIDGAQGDVLVRRVRIDSKEGALAALGIQSASATVEDVTASGGLNGLALSVSGEAAVRRLALLDDAGLTIGSGTVLLDDVAVPGITTLTGGRVTSRETRFGSAVLVMGSGLIAFESGSLSGVTIVDVSESGGLLTDPTLRGANPEEVYSAIDFDHDPQQCADYPPPQTRPDTGECLRPGIPPPR